VNILAGINLDPPTIAEAKLSIKQLRLAKKSLQARRREAGRCASTAGIHGLMWV